MNYIPISDAIDSFSIYHCLISISYYFTTVYLIKSYQNSSSTQISLFFTLKIIWILIFSSNHNLMSSTSYIMPILKMLVMKTFFQRETNKKYKFYQLNVPPLPNPSKPKKKIPIAIRIPLKNMSIPPLGNKLEKERKNMLKV